jgi:hypothetical protein
MAVKKSGLLLILLFFALTVFSQDKVKMTSSFDLHLNHISYDPLRPYKTTGRGGGLQIGINMHTAFNPILEIDEDNYTIGPQEMNYITFNGKDVRKHFAINILGGVNMGVYKGLKMNFLIGPSFLDSYRYLAIKPAMLYCFGKNERFFGKIALTYIRTIYGDTIQPFEYLSFSAGIKIF